MPIAIYTIAKNESTHVARWAASARETDLIFLADTGSTDDTVRLAKECGVSVARISVSPWRFDDARNAALALLPTNIDWCIALDMDEVLQPDWRQALEQLSPRATRAHYKYVWSWNADGSEGAVFHSDKIHRRHGYRWKHAAHEILVPNQMEEQQEWCGLEIHHHPDHSKSRSSYLPLLALAAREDPSCARTAHYYGRELYFHRRLTEAASEFKRHLALPGANWRVERARSMRYLAECEPDSAERWLRLACQESDRRETWTHLARWHYTQKRWTHCLEASKRALIHRTRSMDYLCEPQAWGADTWDIAALAAFHCGDKATAQAYGQQAIALNSKDTRLKRNQSFYETSGTSPLVAA